MDEVNEPEKKELTPEELERQRLDFEMRWAAALYLAQNTEVVDCSESSWDRTKMALRYYGNRLLEEDWKPFVAWVKRCFRRA
jgi:hypothetical protein